MNREDVVQAALTVERWCKETHDFTGCGCPFKEGETCRFFSHVPFYPWEWDLEEFLRTRGLTKCHSSK